MRRCSALACPGAVAAGWGGVSGVGAVTVGWGGVSGVVVAWGPSRQGVVTECGGSGAAVVGAEGLCGPG